MANSPLKSKLPSFLKKHLRFEYLNGVVKAWLNIAPGDPDVGVVDVMLRVVCPQ